MLFSKKGQDTVEYLVVLSVMIVTALVIVALIGGVPGLGPSGETETAELFWVTGHVGFNTHSIKDNSVKLVVKNNLMEDIIITSIVLGSSGLGLPKTELKSDETKAIIATLTGKDSCKEKGDEYSLNVKITYTKKETGESLVYTGENKPLKGICE
jgi:hypothetical protein